MKLCIKQGNGVCINCPKNLPNSWGDVCRYDAEILLDCLMTIIDTEWTQEQEGIFADFGIRKKGEVKE